jgi:hypothetical protein
MPQAEHTTAHFKLTIFWEDPQEGLDEQRKQQDTFEKEKKKTDEMYILV